MTKELAKIKELYKSLLQQNEQFFPKAGERNTPQASSIELQRFF